MERLRSIFLDVQFTDNDGVFNTLLEEGFDDMETLKEAREDDLRSAGLKMGDIIKIRRVLANQSDREALTSSLSLSGSSISELEPENTDMCEAVSSTPKPKEELNKNGQASIASPQVTCSYSAQDLLSKCAPGTKCTRAQLYFRNLLRDCARQSKIWDKAYPLPSIPDGKLNKFFELVNAAAPQLKGYKNEVKTRLGQALQNKRKYRNDVKVGKRKGKNGNNDANTDAKVQCRKSICKFLEREAASSCSQNSTDCDSSTDTSTKKSPDAHSSAFSHGEEVFVYKTAEKKLKLAKAIFVGPDDESDKAGMYSLLQLNTKYIKEDEEIPLPAETVDGDLTLNEVQVNGVFTWKTIKLSSISKKEPPRKKLKSQTPLVTMSKEQPGEADDGNWPGNSFEILRDKYGIPWPQEWEQFDRFELLVKEEPMDVNEMDNNEGQCVQQIMNEIAANEAQMDEDEDQMDVNEMDNNEGQSVEQIMNEVPANEDQMDVAKRTKNRPKVAKEDSKKKEHCKEN